MSIVSALRSDIQSSTFDKNDGQAYLLWKRRSAAFRRLVDTGCALILSVNIARGTFLHRSCITHLVEEKPWGNTRLDQGENSDLAFVQFFSISCSPKLHGRAEEGDIRPGPVNLIVSKPLMPEDVSGV